MIGDLLMKRLIVSQHAYITKVVVRGIPAAHHPNRHRPYYRKVRRIIPTAVATKDWIVVHPVIYDKIKETLKDGPYPPVRPLPPA